MREQEMTIRYEQEVERRKEALDKSESLGRQLEECFTALGKQKSSFQDELKKVANQYADQLARRGSKIKRLKQEMVEMEQQCLARVKEFEKEILHAESVQIEL